MASVAVHDLRSTIPTPPGEIASIHGNDPNGQAPQGKTTRYSIDRKSRHEARTDGARPTSNTATEITTEFSARQHRREAGRDHNLGYRSRGLGDRSTRGSFGSPRKKTDILRIVGINDERRFVVPNQPPIQSLHSAMPANPPSPTVSPTAPTDLDSQAPEHGTESTADYAERNPAQPEVTSKSKSTTRTRATKKPTRPLSDEIIKKKLRWKIKANCRALIKGKEATVLFTVAEENGKVNKPTSMPKSADG